MDVDNGITSQLIPMPVPDALPVPEPGPSGGAAFSSKLDFTDMAQALPDFQSENTCVVVCHRLTQSLMSTAPPQREPIRELCVKVHIRRPGKDSWTYLGRAFVSQEFSGHNSRVGEDIRSGPCCVELTHADVSCAHSRPLCYFQQDHGHLFRSEDIKDYQTKLSDDLYAVNAQLSDLQAEKRGNFVVISCVEGAGVVSWSLNVRQHCFVSLKQAVLIELRVQTMNNAETLKLLASIELACYRCRQALSDPKQHSKMRRRIERVIKEDRRKRHRRRRDEEAMVEAFERQQL